MKKTLPLLALLGITFCVSATNSYAQTICPTLVTNNVSLPCTTPCATLSVTPTYNLAATTTYSVSAIPFTPFTYTGTAWACTIPGSPTTWSTSTDDNFGNLIPLPFTFCFFGNSYTGLTIGTNGNISFNTTGGTSVVNSYDPWSISGPLPGSNSTATQNCIMGVWEDTYVGGGPITWSIQGTAPCRAFVASWNAVDLFLPGTYCTGQHLTSQIVIYESTNIIDVYIANRVPCSGNNWNSGLAVCGIENNAGTLYYCPPGENGTTFTATNLGWRFTPTGAVGAWNYTWHGPGGTAGTGATVTVCPSVTTTYTVVASATACTGVTLQATSTVTTNGSLTPITGPTSVCAGSTIALTDQTAGGTWTSSNTSIATVGLNSGIVSGLSGGTVTITYSQGGCNALWNVTVVQPGVLTGASLCPGGTTTLSDSPAGGTWTSTTTSVATIGLTSGIVTGVSPGVTTISYSLAPGCVTTALVNVATPSPITGITSLCQNTTSTLGNSAPGGTWSSANTTIATVGLTSGVVTGGASGVTTITYTLGGGCRVTTSVTVNPVLPITGVTSLCQRRATTTLSNGTPGGTWSSGNAAIATVEPATGIVHGVAGGTVNISYTTPAGCISVIAVIVNPTPPPPGVTPLSYCQYFTPATQIAATGTGPTFTWWGTGVTTGYFPGPTPSTAVPGIDSYYVTQTSSFGCESDSALELVTIKPFPATPVVSDTTYCQNFGSPAPLSVQVSGTTGTLNWYLSGNLLTSTPTPSTANATYPVGNTWYVSQTVNGCQGDSAAITVQIVYLPDFTIADRPWVCQYDSISMMYVPAGPALINGSFLWTLPPGANFVGGTSQTGSSVLVQFDSVNSSNYVYLTVGNLNGECSTTDTALIDVVKLPTANATSKADVCMSDTVSLALSDRSASANDFVWYVDNTPLFSSTALNIIASNSNSGGPFSISWNDTGMHIIHVEAYAEHGCTDKPSADTVYVRPLPDATFYVRTLGGTLCLDDSVLFAANDSSYTNSYNWAPAHFFNSTDKHAEWGRVQLDQSVVTLTVTDPFGCVATSSKELDPSACCSVPFPNAFTPNGDGHNDVFRPVPQRAYHTYHEFRIQNRWGQTVFECRDNKAEWDGTFGGVPQDMGVYFWYLKYDCNGQTVEEKGDVTLIR